jgi:hypothetical protein
VRSAGSIRTVVISGIEIYHRLSAWVDLLPRSVFDPVDFAVIQERQEAARALIEDWSDLRLDA